MPGHKMTTCEAVLFTFQAYSLLAVVSSYEQSPDHVDQWS